MLYGADQNSPGSPQPVGANTCRLLNEPNRKNFIVFYASVESKLWNYLEKLATYLNLNYKAQQHSVTKRMELILFKVSVSS